MTSYELYERVMETLNGDEGTFNACARNWIEGAEEPHFEVIEANELFYTAKLACAAWRNKAINGRSSKIRMINCVRKIAEMNLPNPYQKVKEYGIMSADVAIKDDPEAIKGSTQIEKEEPKPVEKVTEPTHVLGIIPEEKKTIFNKHKKR